jgi:hypothetical protein
MNDADVKNESFIINHVDLRNAPNEASGDESEANMGAIRLKNATVDHSIVGNDVEVTNSINEASGYNSQASMGSIKISSGSEIRDSLVGNVGTEITGGSTNLASGSGSTATSGSIQISRSEVTDSAVLNSARIDNTDNTASGDDAIARVGSIRVYPESTIKNHSIIGNVVAVNDSENTASGKDSRARMATVEIDNSEVSGSNVLNIANVNSSTNVASGDYSEANTSSVVVK